MVTQLMLTLIWKSVAAVLVNEGHAVLYHGQAKADVQQAHMANRARLLKEGVVK